MKTILIELSDEQHQRLKTRKGKRTWLDMLSQAEATFTKEQLRMIDSMIAEALETFKADFHLNR